MTETWAPLLEVTAMMVEDDSPDRAAKLRRLASLLEQITPEMAEAMGEMLGEALANIDEYYGTRTKQAKARWAVYATAQAGCDLLSALSTAPTEETEER